MFLFCFLYFDDLNIFNFTFTVKKWEHVIIFQNADFLSLFKQKSFDLNALIYNLIKITQRRRALAGTGLFWKHTFTHNDFSFFLGYMTFNRPEFLSVNAIVIPALISVILISCHCLLYLIWKSSITNLLSALCLCNFRWGHWHERRRRKIKKKDRNV